MTTKSETSFLEQEINNSIQVLKQKTKVHKKKTSIINALSISLGAMITLTLGLDFSSENAQLQKNTALILGAILTIVSGWNALFDYKKLWARQKSTLLDLYQIQNELGYRNSKEGKCQIDDLFEKYQRVWEKDSNEWRSIIQTPPKQIQQSSNNLITRNDKSIESVVQ